MSDDLLHTLVRRGDLTAVRQHLGAPQLDAPTPGINALDEDGYSPLMRAVMDGDTPPEIVRTLLEHGADVNMKNRPGEYVSSKSVLSHALGAGQPEVVRLLLAHGANLLYLRDGNYTAVIDAIHSRDIARDKNLLELLRLLKEHGADLNTVTKYGEAALRVLSRLGRFDAVRWLLDAGADEGQLGWNPLLRAVALGSVDDLRATLAAHPPLEEKDFWERTPYLLAIQTGDVEKVRLMLEHGAHPDARGRCGRPPLFYAVEDNHLPMLRFLLESGQSVEQTDEFGDTPLMTAAECGNAEAVAMLLDAGAQVDAKKNRDVTALEETRDCACAVRLLAAGADPQRLSYEGRRALLRLPPEPDESLLDVTAAQYQAGCARRFGDANPQETCDPYRLGMIQAGIDAWSAARLFEGEREFSKSPPVWCARRFGQSITFLSDGRIVQVGGEHEDSYDPDFCIYNDVFVHHPDGTIQIFDYPKEIFPPTDFHTATLIGTDIYLIGSLGYHGERRYGTTPVYRLDTETFRMIELSSSGKIPGWLSRHTAVLISPQEIRVSGGKIATEEAYEDNAGVFIYHVGRQAWTRES